MNAARAGFAHLLLGREYEDRFSPVFFFFFFYLQFTKILIK